MSSRIDEVLEELNKKYKKKGEIGVNYMNSMESVGVPVLQTGNVEINRILGGGVPLGRIVEIYGPEASGKTAIAQLIIRDAQVKIPEKRALFVDFEQAFSPADAESIGIDLDKLLFYQPSVMEDGLETAYRLIETGDISVVVFDSVSAMQTRRELEGDFGDSNMGLVARMMGQACRKLVSLANSKGTIVIFINQIRHKIGVMFGCFHYSSRIMLADGSTEKIGKIVNNKIPAEVLSYNKETGRIEPRKVVGWYDNGKADRFLNIRTTKNYGNGVSHLSVTENHLINTPSGYKRAADLRVGDEVIGKASSIVESSENLPSFLMGCVLGDGSIRLSRSGKTAALRIGHGKDQIDYCKWKQDKLEQIVGYRGPHNQSGGWNFSTKNLAYLKEYRENHYDSNKKVLPKNLEMLTPLALAIWFMDDGTYDQNRRYRSSICVKSFSSEDLERLKSFLEERYGFSLTTHNGSIVFPNKTQVTLLNELIARYVHPSMEYKLLPEYRGLFSDFELNIVLGDVTCIEKVVSSEVKPKARSMRKFDIQVEGNHNYLVDGVVVHNSPETTSGGNALKFFASVRMKVRKTKSIKKADEVIGHELVVEVIKNKVAPPSRKAELRIMYGNGGIFGIDPYDSLIKLAVLEGVIEKRGPYYKMDDDVLGQGTEKTVLRLMEEPSLYEDIYNRVMGISN